MICAYCDRPIRGRHVIMRRFKSCRINDNPNPQPKDFAPENYDICEECCNDMGIKITK